MPNLSDNSDQSAPELKAVVRQRIEADRDRLLALSHVIHDHPETAFEEAQAARWATEELSRAGFEIESAAGGLDTAFSASYGTGDLTVGYCVEYDALPGMGHACGHNMIAAMSVGAALGLSAVADTLGIRIKAIGTPAEEHGGGKSILLERGVFDDVSVALMAHPGPVDIHPRDFRTRAAARFTATYHGRAAHTSAPQLGINAADAAVVAQVAIGQLRQQIGSECRIGLFVRKGGEATNIIPDETIIEGEVRAVDEDEFEALYRRVVACLEAGAHATGTTLEITQPEPNYLPLKQDTTLGDLYGANLVELGREFLDAGPFLDGSSDMGNVSQVVPSIHPWIAIVGAKSVPHTVEFTDETASPAADDTVFTGALALAWTGLDVALDRTAREGFVEALKARVRPSAH